MGAAMLAKALAGVFLIFLSTGAGVAIAGYLMIAPPKPPGPVPPPIPGIPTTDSKQPGVGRRRRPARRPAHAARARLRPARQELARRPARRVRAAALGHDRAGAPGPQAPSRRGAQPPARPRGDDPRLQGRGQDQRGLRRGRRRAGAQDRPEPVLHRDGQAVRGQRRDRRQLPRLPGGRQLRPRRLRRRRSPLLQPRGHGLLGDRHRAGLPAARRLGRARLRALPPHRLRPLPQRSPAGLHAPGGQPEGGPRPPEHRRRQEAARPPRAVLRLRQEVPQPQEPRRPAQDRRQPRAPSRAGQPDRAAGDHGVRRPHGRHAAVHLQREHPRRPTTSS